jgi:DNA-binding NarL/FixJ family response regulator
MPPHPVIGHATTIESRNRTLIVADGHEALREALSLLVGQWGFRCLGSTGDARRAEQLILSGRPDVAVVDVDLAERGDGARLVDRLVKRTPALPFLLYTGAREEHVLRQALAVGARGLLTKAASARELRAALEAVAGGHSYLDHRLSTLVVSGRDRAGRLSAREREILILLARGDSGERIAARLVLSPETVRTHVRNAMDKLGARTRAHAIALALLHGHIELPDADAG